MARAYDTSFKELIMQQFVTLLPWLLPDVQSHEVIKLSEELPATLRRTDILARVLRSPRSSESPGSPRIVMFECQCQADPLLPKTMALRSILAHYQYDLLVESVLLAFTPQAVTHPEYTFGTSEAGASLHRITVRRVFAESADAALRTGIDALLPLVPAMCPENGDSEALLCTALERIIDRVSSDEQRKLMLDWAATFATLRLSERQVAGIVKNVCTRRRYMLDPIRDFPWLRAGYDQGVQHGEARGEARGKARGKAESVLTVLLARGIAVSDVERARILACTDVETLDCWLALAATAANVAELFRST